MGTLRVKEVAAVKRAREEDSARQKSLELLSFP